jgi:hypothetical protein
MSYTVAVVAPPISALDAEARAALDALIDQLGPAPAVFQTLHDGLTARYPCLSSLPDDQIDDGVWSDGPLWNNFGPRAAVLGISYSRVDEVLPFLIESIPANGFEVTVKENERLGAADVKMILTAFADRERRPNAFAWRDVTERFA